MALGVSNSLSNLKSTFYNLFHYISREKATAQILTCIMSEIFIKKLGWGHATTVMLDSSSGPLFPCGSYHQPRCSVNTEKQYINRKCIIDFDFQITINNHFKQSFLTTHLNQLNVHNGVSIEIHHCTTPIFCRVPCFCSNIDISNTLVLCLAFYLGHSF